AEALTGKGARLEHKCELVANVVARGWIPHHLLDRLAPAQDPGLLDAGTHDIAWRRAGQRCAGDQRYHGQRDEDLLRAHLPRVVGPPVTHLSSRPVPGTPL